MTIYICGEVRPQKKPPFFNARALITRKINYAQYGCAMQYWGITRCIQYTESKINISKFQFDREFEGHRFVSLETVMCYPR